MSTARHDLHFTCGWHLSATTKTNPLSHIWIVSSHTRQIIYIGLCLTGSTKLNKYVEQHFIRCFICVWLMLKGDQFKCCLRVWLIWCCLPYINNLIYNLGMWGYLSDLTWDIIRANCTGSYRSIWSVVHKLRLLCIELAWSVILYMNRVVHHRGDVLFFVMTWNYVTSINKSWVYDAC